jgi:HK97 family phage major capsid protein
MTIADLRKKRAAAYDSFAAVATKEGVFTDAEKANHAELRQAVKSLDEQIDRAVEAQELASRSARPVDGDEPADRVLARRPLYSALKSYKNITTERGAVMRGEEQAYRVGKWLLATMFGIPEARQWCADNGVPIVRAQSEGVNSAGGELVPEEMMASIIVLRETFGVFRREAQVIPMGRDTLNWPRRTGGVTAYFVAEGQAPTESQAAWDNVNLTAKKLAALVRLSTELSDDAIINVADWLTSEIAYAFASKEDDCGFNGDGTSLYGGITGITQKFLGTSATAGLFTATGHATFDVLTATDIEQMRALLPFYALPGAKIYCSQYAFALCFERLIAAGGGNSIATLNGEIVYRYLGTPIVISQKMVSTTPTGKIGIIYGDLAKAAALGERRQVSIKRSDERYFDTDQIGIMGTERVDVNVHDVGDTVNTGPLVALKMG